MSATTRIAAPTAAATRHGSRDRVRSRTRANGSAGRAEKSSARFAVGGEPSATALRASRDDDPGRFRDDPYGYERPLDSGARRRDRYGGGYDGYGTERFYDRDGDGSWSDDAATASSSSSSGYYSDGAHRRGPPPDVTLLTQRETQALLPIGATGEQYGYFWGGPETATQRLGASLLGVVAFVNVSSLLAVPAATFFLWAPVALAARRNAAARRGRNVGLWRCRVLAAVPRESPPTPGFYDRSVDAPESWMLSLTVGDDSGAVVEIRVPLRASHADVREGDACEMVVGSDDNYFGRFEAVREAYFPETDTWIGEYPFLDRRAMPRISARIAHDAEARREWEARRRAPARGDASGDPDAYE